MLNKQQQQITDNGLSQAEVRQRLQRYGYNTIETQSWMWVIVLSIIPLAYVEIEKLFRIF